MDCRVFTPAVLVPSGLPARRVEGRGKTIWPQNAKSTEKGFFFVSFVIFCGQLVFGIFRRTSFAQNFKEQPRNLSGFHKFDVNTVSWERKQIRPSP
jgi:hypothetical protein